MKYGAAQKVLPKLQEVPDVILVNPPREGLSKAVYPHLKASKLIYISCNPSTLARDIKALSRTYEVEKVEGFDLFPQTTHLETIVLLKRKKNP
jgi:tRNA/tmRNA/rRNA uracil-C5-methylase (TrmA/RlmC/RlmD family)